MVKGGDSCSEGCEFKSQVCILDGHFFTFVCCENCYVCLKKAKIKEQEAEDGPFFQYCDIFNESSSTSLLRGNERNSRAPPTFERATVKM